MASIPRTRSVGDLHHVEPPEELRDSIYSREVLQLEHVTEDVLDEAVAREAEAFGIDTPIAVANTRNGHTVHTSLCESADTVVSRHARSGSSGSQVSASTALTSRSLDESPIGPSPMLRKQNSTRKSLSFADYDRYLVQTAKQQMMNANGYLRAMPPEPAPSLFSVSTRKSFNSIKSTLKKRLRLRRNHASRDDLSSCVCCRDDFKMNKTLHSLPCHHKYCERCLNVVVLQASSDESKMPPKCCGKPLPGVTIKSVLTREEQAMFMKSVTQFSTPWGERIFCPNPTCGEFIPKRHKIDPKHPFEVVCKKCRTRACSTCKREAHNIGQDCPADWELDIVLKMGENHGWRRCYKCRNLVELTHGCSHITCRCKAQFCYICGAVWDPVVGCPNYCNGEEELERRRLEEAEREAAQQAEKEAQEAAAAANAAEMIEAIKRTETSEELNALRAQQINERDRFSNFERKMKWVMWTRHGQEKIAILDRYTDLQAKMKERHSKTASHLEDRQVAAEMELRSSLKQSERSVQIRLRHMEAYCDGLGRSANGNNPARVVTERDLRELGQQYNLRDDLERLHQARINVMREKQGKQMENLLERQEEELNKLAGKQEEELDAQEEAFGREEDNFIALFRDRRERLLSRWTVIEEVTRKKLENHQGLKYVKMEDLDWPEPELRPGGLDSVGE